MVSDLRLFIEIISRFAKLFACSCRILNTRMYEYVYFVLLSRNFGDFPLHQALSRDGVAKVAGPCRQERQ